MTTRNLTSLFMSFRQTMRRHTYHDEGHGTRGSTSDGKALLSHGGDMEMGNVQYDLPPAWSSTVDQVKDGLARIKKRMDELKIAHEKHLLPGFDDMDTSEQEVEVLTAEISRLFKTCEAKIRFIGKELSTMEATHKTQEAKVLKNLQSYLAVQLSELHTQFRKSQKHYLNKLHEGQNISNDPVHNQATLGQDEDELGIDMGFSREQKGLVMFNEDLIKEREQEIGKITESIEELAILFKDLQTLVIDQGTLLDRIDYNLEQVQSNVETAVEQLIKAEKSQKKSKLMLCIIILCVVIGILLLAIIIKTSSRK